MTKKLIAACFSFISLITATAYSRDEPDKAAATLAAMSVAEIDVLTEFVLCDGPTFGDHERTGRFGTAKYFDYMEQFGPAFQRIQEKLQQSQSQSKGNNHPLPIKTRVVIDKIVFTEIAPLFMQGVAQVVSYSPTAQIEDFRRLMRARGVEFKAVERVHVSSGQTIPVWRAKQFGGESVKQYSVVQGRRLSNEDNEPLNKNRQGLSIACNAHEANEQEQKAAGVVSESSVKQILESEKKQPKQWFDTVLRNGTPDARLALASYRYLSAPQVQRLLDLNNPELTANLIYNSSVQLSDAQIEMLFSSGEDQAMYSLISRYHVRLNAGQRQKLAANEYWQSHFLLRVGGQSGARELARLIELGDQPRIQGALHQADIFFHDDSKLPLIDVILASGIQDIKEFVSMRSKMMYSPAQIQTFLDDPDKNVRIGILRRPELVIPAEWVNRGVNDPDEDVAFWYRSRSEEASSKQIGSKQ